MCSGDGIEREDVLDLMSRLVDKSLVMVGDGGDGRRRYRYLETVRQYAWERLRRSGEADAVRARHFGFFLELARRAEPQLIRADQLRWLDRLQSEHDNLRAALEWALASDNPGHESLQLAASLHWFWLKRAHLAEGQQWLERALARSLAPPAAQRAQALMALGSIGFFKGDFERAQACWRRASRWGARQASTRPWPSPSVCTLAAMERGDFAGAGQLAGEWRRPRGAATPGSKAFRCCTSRYAALYAGDIDRAGGFHEEALALLRAQGELWGMGIALFDLALLRVVQQRHAEARALCGEAIAIGRQFGDPRAIAWCLGVLAGADAAEGRPRAPRGFEARWTACSTASARPCSRATTRGSAIVSRVFCCRSWARDGYRRALAAGRALSMSQAIDYATDEQAAVHGRA